MYNNNKQPIALLRSSINTLCTHPIILAPLSILAFIQFLILEIMFFAPRYPLSKFFAPFIMYLHGEAYLHYPFNFAVIVKWYHHWMLQFPIHVLFTSFFLGAMINIINSINNEKKVNLKSVYTQTFGCYVYLFVAALISVLIMFGLMHIYSLIIKRALIIRSTSGIFYMVKQVVLQGTPYFQLLIGIFVTTLLAFMFPLIVIEKKKLFSSIFYNFKYLWKSFWLIFLITLLPTLLYVPLLLLKTHTKIFQSKFFPEMSIIFIVFTILILVLIDAIQYTAITTFYLLKREEK